MADRDLLVVENDADIRDLIMATLAAAGHRADAVVGGRAALESFAARRPELMVIDLDMPDLAGLDVCVAVKSAADPRPCAVVLLAAASAEQDVAAGYRAGADDYVVKPFSPRELVRRIEALLPAPPRTAAEN